MLFYWILHSSKNPEKKKTAVMKFAENSELHLNSRIAFNFDW